MKARLTAPVRRRILAYRLSEHMERPLKDAAEAFGAELVLTADHETPVGRLLDGETQETRESGEAPQDTCLLIAGFDREALSGFVDSLRETGVRIPLKAMYTPHNKDWSFTQLIAELKREHEYMTGGAKR